MNALYMNVEFGETYGGSAGVEEGTSFSESTGVSNPDLVRSRQNFVFGGSWLSCAMQTDDVTKSAVKASLPFTLNSQFNVFRHFLKV